MSAPVMAWEVPPINRLFDHILDAADAVDQMGGAIATVRAADEKPGLEEVVRAGQNLRAVIDQARDALYALLAYGHELMPQNQVVLEGVGPVEKTGGWDRKDWEHSALAAKVVQWVAEERRQYAQDHDGELPPESEGQHVARRLLEAAGISYWKVGVAKEHGVDVDQFCRKEPARKGIKLPKLEE